MYYEVELKFAVSDLRLVEQQLARLGAQGDESPDRMEQLDLYLKHPARDFASTDEALRIRVFRLRGNQHAVVTYKGPKLDPTTKTRREIELPLRFADESQTVSRWRELFAALGFEPVAEVKKQRRTMFLEIQSHRVDVALDQVEGLGSFVELEIVADQTGIAAAQACLAELAARLELGPSERRGYLELLLAQRNAAP